MNDVRKLDGAKLKAARGARTQFQIAERAGFVFSPQQVSGWEKEHYRPRPEVVPAYLDALGVSYESVSIPIKVARRRRKVAPESAAVSV